MSNPSSTSLPNPSHLFHAVVAEKLDDSNYLHWKQQVEPIIKAHKLHRFVVNPAIPFRFLSEEDRNTGLVNPAYEEWEVQDQILLA